MRQFQDKDGRKWDVVVDFAAIRRVRELAGFELLKIVEDEGKLLYELRDNLELLVNVVYSVCRDQIEAHTWRKPYPGLFGRALWRFGIGQRINGRSDEAFGKAMGGDALEHAWDAIITEMIQFFPTGRRQLLARAAIVAGAASLLDHKTKMEALDLPPMNANEKSSRWQGVSALFRGVSPSAN